MKKRTKKKVVSVVKAVFIGLFTIIKYFFKALWWIITGIAGLISKGVKKGAQSAQEASVVRSMTSASRTPARFDDLTVVNTIAGEYADFSSSLLSKSLVLLIFGKRGSGKSTLGFRFLENINAKTKRPCFVLGVNQGLLPSWIDSVNSLDEAKENGVVLVDEGALEFGARESMRSKNVELGKLLAIARHKGLTLILVTQNTGMIDKNVLRLTDVIIAKEGSLLQKRMERSVVADFVEKADAAIKPLEKDERLKHAYIFSDDFEGVISASLPSFWNENVSKSRK